jgi:hypothetical protein
VRVRSIDAVLRFGGECDLGCDCDKGSHWALEEEEEEEELFACVNNHCPHVLVLAHDRGRVTTEIVNTIPPER